MAFTTIADLYSPAKRGRATGLMGAVFRLPLRKSNRQMPTAEAVQHPAT